MPTKIEWCDETVSPLRVRGGKIWKHGYHCEKSSPGCLNCYAEKMNIMRGTGRRYVTSDTNPDYYIDLKAFDKLPKTVRKRVFVQDMSDLFLPGVPRAMIQDVIFECEKRGYGSGHTFLFLTKHIKEMADIFQFTNSEPHPYIYPGVTVCNQKEADEKIPILLQIPAAKRFVSFEPALEDVDFTGLPPWWGTNQERLDGPIVDWIIVGCESLGRGKAGRGGTVEIVRSVVRQCADANVPCFVKQISIDGRVSKNMDEWPADLRVRQLPERSK